MQSCWTDDADGNEVSSSLNNEEMLHYSNLLRTLIRNGAYSCLLRSKTQREGGERKRRKNMEEEKDIREEYKEVNEENIERERGIENKQEEEKHRNIK